MVRVASLILLIFWASVSLAQDGQSDAPAAALSATEIDRSATGGAQTREDIMARQRGEKVDYEFRRENIGDPDRAAPATGQLGTLGGISDADVFRALRYGSADVTASNDGPASTVLIQDSGMQWLQFRQGPLLKYGGYLLLGMLGLLVLFYLLRGKIRIDGGRSGESILRFRSIERFGHWLFAGSFIILAITGLLTLFGRVAISQLFARTEENGGSMANGTIHYGLELLGPDGYESARASFASMALAAKWLHNNVAWAFMLGLVMVIVMWVVHNIPNRHDVVWLAKAGGLFSKGVHPPARKFNAGQKGIFWACVVLGISISVSGLSLLFPFEMPIFAKTFALLNDIGAPGWFGYGPLPVELAPHQEMQLSQAWHAIIGFVFMAIIMAHIYLGSVGMEGAFDAMSTGEVDKQWAREHHGLWVEEVEARQNAEPDRSATPAE